MKLLELNDVTVSFQSPDGSRMTALRDMSLSVEQGELVALVGPSGCGKSTALNVLAGQVRPVSGQVRLAGEPVKGVSPSVGYISQADTLLPWRTVLDNVALAMELRGVEKRERREAARGLMARMGLSGFEDNYPRELSGGMKKRAAIARVLASEEDAVCVVHGGVTAGLMMTWFGGGRYDYSVKPGTGFTVTFRDGKPVSYERVP